MTSLSWFVEEPPESVICSLCCGVFVDPRQCPNNHIYCECCLQKAINYQRKCPMCRCDLNLDKCLPVSELDHKIDNLEMFCVPVDSAVIVNAPVCFWTGKRSSIEEHSNYTCLAKVVSCLRPNCNVKYLKYFESHHERLDHNAESGCDLISPEFVIGEVVSQKNLHDNVFSGSHKFGLRHGTGETISASGGYTYKGGYLYGDRHGTGVCHYFGGDTYEGEWRDDLRHGHCTITSLDGVFSGQCENDVISGQGTKTYNNGDKYEGLWSNGERNGVGVMQFVADGKVYTGNWLDGDLCGEGTMVLTDGSRYQGSWLDNECSGHGSAVFACGDSYDGEWFENEMNGYGVFTWANGQVYRGNFRDGLKCGYGVITYMGGGVYNGEFMNGLREGYGKFMSSIGDTYEGEWLAGKKHGFGEYESVVHSISYKGLWEFGDFHGRGVKSFANGDIYSGEWVANKQHGEGVMRYKDGSISTGKWCNDVYVGTVE